MTEYEKDEEKENKKKWNGGNNQPKQRKGANKLLSASHVKDFNMTDSNGKGELKKIDQIIT